MVVGVPLSPVTDRSRAGLGGPAAAQGSPANGCRVLIAIPLRTGIRRPGAEILRISRISP
jgi:hypothetical protein